MKKVIKKVEEKKVKVVLNRRLRGGPTKYRPEFAQMLINYFDVEPTYIDADGKIVPVRFPTLERFSILIDVCVDVFADWASATKKNKKGEIVLKHPEFLRAYKKAKAMQKDILVANGITGRYASNFAIFVAVNFTDMADRSEIDATSKGDKIMGITYTVPAGASVEPKNGQTNTPRTNA